MLRATILLSKAIIREPRLRRSCMLWFIGIAVVMLFLGSLLLTDNWARKHPWLYFGYWFACGWLTLTGVLLALLDILAIRAAARATRRVLERRLSEESLNKREQ